MKKSRGFVPEQIGHGPDERILGVKVLVRLAAFAVDVEEPQHAALYPERVLPGRTGGQQRGVRAQLFSSRLGSQRGQRRGAQFRKAVRERLRPGTARAVA